MKPNVVINWHILYNGKLVTQGTAQEIILHNKIYTYAINGNNLSHLSLELKTRPGIVQTILFGNTLHVSGTDRDLLSKVLQQLPKQYEIAEIATNLEDVFIHLMDRKAGL